MASLINRCDYQSIDRIDLSILIDHHHTSSIVLQKKKKKKRKNHSTGILRERNFHHQNHSLYIFSYRMANIKIASLFFGSLGSKSILHILIDHKILFFPGNSSCRKGQDKLSFFSWKKGTKWISMNFSG